MSRNALWLALASLVAVVGTALVLIGGDDGTPTDADSAAGGLTGGDFHSLAVDPSDPRRLFAGGHQAVSVSTDGGATWNEIEALRDADAMGWAFTEDAIYVSGHPGLNRSTDGGETFEQVNEGLPDTDLHAFGGSDTVLYAASPAVGVFASDSGLGDWQERNNSIGQSFFGRVLVDPADDNHILAADASAGVAQSTDGGRTWRLLRSGLDSATWISRGGDELDVLVASGPAGAALSEDAGRSWRPLDVPQGVSLVEAVPGDAELLYAGRHEGDRVHVLVSTDGGTTWTSATEPA